MIKNFLIISCTGKNDKIGLKFESNFLYMILQIKLIKMKLLVSNILDLLKKHKVNIDNKFSILVNSGPGSFSSIRVAISVAKGMKISKNVKIFGYRNCDLPQFNLENIEILINKNLIEKN